MAAHPVASLPTQMAGHGTGSAGPGSTGLEAAVPGGPETGEDLPPDRVVPVAERAPAGYRRHCERAAAHHLVLGAEEHLGVLPVRPGSEAGVGQEVAAGPLPHVPDQLARAARGGSLGVAARGRGLEVLLAEVGPAGGRVLVAPGEAPGPPGGRVEPGRLLPLGLGRE